MKLLKEVPALSGERAQYLVHDFNDNTVRFVLNYSGLVDADVLRRAVKAVMDSVDVLHGSFVVEKGKALWRIYEDVAQEAYFQRIKVEGDPAQVGYAQALKPLKPEEPVKLRCALVHNDRSSSVVVWMSHLCVDGGDSKYLLRKIIEGYNRIITDGNADGLQVKHGSREPEQAYAHLSKQEQRRLWRNPMPGTKNEFPFASDDPGCPRMILRMIPREIMAAAWTRAKQAGATVNDLVLAACYQAFAAVPGVDAKSPISVAAMMDLRRHCPDGDSEGITNLAGPLKTIMPDGVTGTYEQTLAAIAEQTRKAKADPLAGLEGVPMLHWVVRNYPMGLLLKVASKVYGNMSIGMTNLGNLSRKDHMLGNLMPKAAMVGGPLKKKPGVQIAVISLDGECALSIVGQYTDEDVDGITQMLDRIVEEIYQYANPQCDNLFPFSSKEVNLGLDNRNMMCYT